MNLVIMYIFWLIVIALVFRVIARWYIRRALK